MDFQCNNHHSGHNTYRKYFFGCSPPAPGFDESGEKSVSQICPEYFGYEVCGEDGFKM